MSIYLIDFENVHYDGLSGILNLTSDDQVYIFYSDNGKRLTFELHEQINNSPAKFYYYKAAVGGKNALDHQLSTYLGFLIGKTKEKHYYIVSKDQGYRHLVTFWKSANLGLEITLIDSIKISKTTKTPELSSAEPEAPVAQKRTAAKRRGRVIKTKQQVEKQDEVESSENTEIDNKNRSTNKRTKKVAQPQNSQPVDEQNVDVTLIANAGTETAAADKSEHKSIPEVVEFNLPDEIISSTKHAKRTPKKENNKTTAEKSVVKTTQKTRTNTAQNKNNEHKQIANHVNENTEAESGKPAIKEADIVHLMPEAAGQPWLADILRYINTSNGRAQLYNAIRRRLGQEQGRTIYNVIKKLI